VKRLTSDKLRDLYENETDEDRRMQLLGTKPGNFVFDENARRKDGRFGKTTHIDELGRHYQMNGNGKMDYYRPKTIAHNNSVRDDDVFVWPHPAEDDILTLKSTKDDSVIVIRVLEQTTDSKKASSGRIDYCLCKKPT
jgi:hypothetical protein